MLVFFVLLNVGSLKESDSPARLVRLTPVDFSTLIFANFPFRRNIKPSYVLSNCQRTRLVPCVLQIYTTHRRSIRSSTSLCLSYESRACHMKKLVCIGDIKITSYCTLMSIFGMCIRSVCKGIKL